MVTEGDREAARREKEEEHRHLKPIESEKPDVGRNGGQREKERADEEGTGDPVDSIEGDVFEHESVREDD